MSYIHYVTATDAVDVTIGDPADPILLQTPQVSHSTVEYCPPPMFVDEPAGAELFAIGIVVLVASVWLGKWSDAKEAA